MMKKIVSLILAVFLVVTSSIAFAADYSSMSEEQLRAEYNAIRNELVSRGLNAENKKYKRGRHEQESTPHTGVQQNNRNAHQ